MEDLYKALIEGTQINPEVLMKLLEEILRNYALYNRKNTERDECGEDDQLE